MKRHLEETDNVDRQHIKFKSDDERLETFKNWLNENNTIWQNIEIRSSTLYQGFALYSKSVAHLPDIEIPTCLLMSKQSAEQSSTFVSPSVDLLDQTEDHIDRETLVLALFLLHERSKDSQSFWYPYIQLLPQTYTTPFFHRESYVETTTVYYLTETMRQSMIEVWDLVALKNLTLEDFLWAYTVISSRAFKIPELGTTLIPLADLANHVSFAQEANLRTVGVDKQTDRFILKATEKSIVEGEELCLKYNSDLSNWQLLLYYGFTIENNPFDSIILELKFNEDEDYEMEMKKMLLINLNDDLSLDHELKLTEDESIISDNLLASLRLVVMTDKELEEYNISNIEKLFSTKVNVDNERRALTKLLNMLNDIKEVSFTNTLEENLERFQSKQLNDDERYSLIYLIGQKRIIEKACQWIDNALSQL